MDECKTVYGYNRVDMHDTVAGCDTVDGCVAVNKCVTLSGADMVDVYDTVIGEIQLLCVIQ